MSFKYIEEAQLIAPLQPSEIDLSSDEATKHEGIVIELGLSREPGSSGEQSGRGDCKRDCSSLALEYPKGQSHCTRHLRPALEDS